LLFMEISMLRCLLFLTAPVLFAADLTTELSVGAASASGGNLTYTWQVVAKPPGSGQSEIEALTPLAGTTNRVRMLLHDAQVGTYQFVAVISDGSLQTTSNQVTVTVQAATSGSGTPPSAAASSGGGSGGCGAGAGIALVLTLSYAGSLRQRSTRPRG
jgi:hypothetical protein